MDVLTNKISERRVDGVIKYLKDNRLGTQPWLPKAAIDVSKSYQKLRYDLKHYKALWSYSQYCERMAFFYYDLASFHYNLYQREKFGLLSVKFLLEKCSSMIDEIPEITFLTEMKELKNEVILILSQIDELVESLEINQQSLSRHKISSREVKTVSMQYVEMGILIGNFEGDAFLKRWNKCSPEDLKKQLKQVQNIKIWKIINFLEEVIREQKNQDQKHSGDLLYSLSAAYELANYFKLKKSFQKHASNIRMRK